MISRVRSFVLQGIDAVPCEIEVDLSPVGLPKTTIVGLPDAAVRESAERVRTAVLNSGYRFPQTRMTINLAPADVKKEGPVYDLPIAVALLVANGTIEASPRVEQGSRRTAEKGREEGEPSPPAPLPEGEGSEGGAARSVAGAVAGAGAGAVAGARAGAGVDGCGHLLGDYLIAGELALDGRVRSVKGVISMAMLAKGKGKRGVIVPRANAHEAAAVGDLEVYGAGTLAEVVGFFNGGGTLPRTEAIDAEGLIAQAEAELDFGDIKGQEAAKRAVTVAAAGAHNVLMIGPPGTGKTMIAKALPGILPALSRDEALEVTRIYSSVGKVGRGQSLITRRPVRTPHHTASSPAVVGGGTVPRPGDVSLAHRGVLFLDELPEFDRGVLETLREPLEDGAITIARAQGSVRFPARFMLVAAMNPTPKGHVSSDEVSRREMERYLSRISGPLIDRIDLHVEVPSVPLRHLTGSARGTDTATMRERVLAARTRQFRRQGSTNSELRGRELDRLAALEEGGRSILAQAMRELGLSARAYDKIRRVARTIADLEGEEAIRPQHVSEAVQYRLLDRRKG